MYHPRMQIGAGLRVVLAALAIVGAASSASAQLSNQEAPVVVGHFHMNATSVAEHRRFWVDTLGGTADKIGSADVVRFPGILLFFDQKKPSGPNRGTAFDHIGFAVPDVPALTTKIVAAGYTLTVGREPVPGKEAAAAQGTQAPYGRFSYILGPDGHEGGAGDERREDAGARSSITTSTSSTSSTSRCGTGTRGR
jgi:hypothetical protein